jgi:hemolysin activation/secretion protein
MKRFTRRLCGLSASLAAGALLLAASAPVSGQGQAFENIAPKEPVKTTPGKVINQAATKPPATGGGDEVVADRLKGVVILSDPKQVHPDGLPGKSGVDTGDGTFGHRADFAAVIQPYLDKRATLNSLAELTRSIVAYYRDHDRPVVNVYVPQQSVVSGVVQIVVLESHVEKVSATGARFFSNNQLRHEVDLRPGDAITSSEMRDDVDWINRNPFLQSDLLLAPGDAPGTTDVLLRTHDRFPLRVYAGYEDSGNAETGFDRYLAGFNYGNFLNLGQQVNYQYTTSGNGDSLRAHSGSYVIPLPWHNTLTFFGSYVETKGSVPPLIGLSGRSYQISGRYTIPLPTLSVASVLTYKHDFAAGFDYKYNDNTLEFGGTPIPGSLYDIDQFVMSYNGTLTDPYGQTTIDDELYVSPGSWGGNNNDSAFDTNHPGASSSYVYNTLVAQRLTKLPADWTLLLRGTLQTSNGNLAQSEQLGFGGYDTVRGYDEREVNADEGYIFTTELRTPTVSFGDAFGCAGFKDQLQFLAFWDYAAAHNNTPLPGEPSEIPLSGIGFGVRYTINTYLSVRYDYGFQLLRTGLDNDHGNRSDLGIVVSY